MLSWPPALAWLRRWAEGRAKLLAVVSLPEKTFRSADKAMKITFSRQPRSI